MRIKKIAKRVALALGMIVGTTLVLLLGFEAWRPGVWDQAATAQMVDYLRSERELVREAIASRAAASSGASGMSQSPSKADPQASRMASGDGVRAVSSVAARQAPAREAAAHLRDLQAWRSGLDELDRQAIAAGEEALATSWHETLLPQRARAASTPSKTNFSDQDALRFLSASQALPGAWERFLGGAQMIAVAAMPSRAGHTPATFQGVGPDRQLSDHLGLLVARLRAHLQVSDSAGWNEEFPTAWNSVLSCALGAGSSFASWQSHLLDLAVSTADAMALGYPTQENLAMVAQPLPRSLVACWRERMADEALLLAGHVDEIASGASSNLDATLELMRWLMPIDAADASEAFLGFPGATQVMELGRVVAADEAQCLVASAIFALRSVSRFWDDDLAQDRRAFFTLCFDEVSRDLERFGCRELTLGATHTVAGVVSSMYIVAYADEWLGACRIAAKGLHIARETDTDPETVRAKLLALADQSLESATIEHDQSKLVLSWRGRYQGIVSSSPLGLMEEPWMASRGGRILERWSIAIPLPSPPKQQPNE